MRYAIKAQSFFFADAGDIPTLALDVGRGTGDCDGGLFYVDGDATSDIAADLDTEQLDTAYLIGSNGTPLNVDPYNLPATMLNALHRGDVAGAVAGVHINLAPASDDCAAVYTVTIHYQAGRYGSAPQPVITRSNVVSISSPAIMRDMLPYGELHMRGDFLDDGHRADTYDIPSEAIDALRNVAPSYTDYTLLYRDNGDGTVTIDRYELIRD